MPALVLAAALELLTPLASAGEVHVEPRTGERYVLERPPSGPARGAWPVPGWVAWAMGGLVFLGAAGTLAARLRRAKD